MISSNAVSLQELNLAMIKQMKGVFSKKDDEHQLVHQNIAEPKQEYLVNSKKIHINGKEISYLNVS